MNTYNLSKSWFAFSYAHSETKPIHTALYFWILERGNGSGWKKIIDIQTEKSMEALGVSDWRTYKNALQFLSENGFILWVEKSKNQYTCNKVTLLEKEEIDKSITDAYALNAEANAEAVAEAIVEAYAEADVKAIAEALQSYINLKTNKQTNKETIKPDAGASDFLTLPVTPSKKSRKNKKPESDKPKSLFKCATDLFCEFYLAKFNTKYLFSGAKDGIAVQGLIEKISLKTLEAEKDLNDENILVGLTLFLESINDQWVLKNFTPAIINQKFNELFISAKNGNSKEVLIDPAEFFRQKYSRTATANC